MADHHHRIHLGGAWEPPSRSADGTLVWTRRFGRPAGLAPGDRVLLVFARPGVAADLVLNAARLPSLSVGTDRWERDVTPLLRVRNELLVTVAAGIDRLPGDTRLRADLPSVIGRVVLEIMAAETGEVHGRDA